MLKRLLFIRIWYEVDELREENAQLKQLVAELALKNRVLKKV